MAQSFGYPMTWRQSHETLRVKLRVNFPKLNPLRHFFVEFLAGITLKIRVKCNKQVLLVVISCKIQVISASKSFIGLAPGDTELNLIMGKDINIDTIFLVNN